MAREVPFMFEMMLRRIISPVYTITGLIIVHGEGRAEGVGEGGGPPNISNISLLLKKICNSSIDNKQ